MKGILRTLRVAAPVALVLLLAGCVTDPYRYGGGYGGDYYYGRPSVEYRHHGYYGDYGYPYYGRSGWSFGLRYGYPYGYYGRYGRYGYGGWPYYYGGGGWPYYPPIIVRPHPDPDPDTGHDPDPDTDPQGPPPWRDLDRLRDGEVNPPIQLEPRAPRSALPPRMTRPQVSRPPVTRAPRPQVERPSRPTGGNRIQRIRQSIEDRDER